MQHEACKEQGFTLIELSIVLVIIGLIVGGVLVGQNLISAAAVRAQITQIEKFQTETATFQGKYGYLPGDIKDPDASNFGFQARGSQEGQGDGNGIIEGIQNSGASGQVEHEGEIPTFWADLGTAHLIEGAYTGSPTNQPASDLYTSQIVTLLPLAKLGQLNYIYVWSFQGRNYFGLSAINHILANSNSGDAYGTPGLIPSLYD